MSSGTGPIPDRGTPRNEWDRQPPTPISVADWAQGPFVEQPNDTYYNTGARGNGVVVPGLPPWIGQQGLSGRERSWIREPILRSVDYGYLATPGELARRTQLREAILVTRAGRQPPVVRNHWMETLSKSEFEIQSMMSVSKSLTSTTELKTTPNSLSLEFRETFQEIAVVQIRVSFISKLAQRKNKTLTEATAEKVTLYQTIQDIHYMVRNEKATATDVYGEDELKASSLLYRY
ncbi:hypothetical protein BGW36DRAFT_410630 [Talaromyces proteolyticus]|uniref:Uncharacterized protein n=1 Tax=Talaromyces proteolyticus TaxID=1131652 RepID=A0AAD4KI13_9EURO|nr:uncharacterized protein BGW36DRAFT_410630 [Talaromyces proteolyticus]KAH8692131.1 hypothetical protein BGW36DRAFT_410630 [Talaromyces proteolyticus]